MLPFDLSGKRFLITGASSGIGRACAIAASSMGASLVLTARNDDALEETRQQCRSGEHIIFSGDITNADFIIELVTRSGKIDGLVHAAGVAPMCPTAVLTRNELESSFQINYFSFVELMRFYARQKYRNKAFSAVVISSVSALIGWPGGVAYCGSKGAVSASVRAMALELAPKGVRVNAVCPSNIRTPLYLSGAVEVNDDVALQELIKKQPLGLGEPEQVAWPVCFLLSEAANFITGIDLAVDGGYLAQ